MYFWRFSLFTIFNRKTSCYYKPCSFVPILLWLSSDSLVCCRYKLGIAGVIVHSYQWPVKWKDASESKGLGRSSRSWKGHNRIQKLITCTSESNILLDNVTHNGLDLANSTTINCKRHRCCLAKNPVPLLLSWKSNLAPLSGKTVYDKYGEPIRQWQSEEWRELRELRMKHWGFFDLDC
jgi:hypothetical protein